jgi:hypothetical protein
LLTHRVARIPPAIDVFAPCSRKLGADAHRWQENINKRVEICVEDVWTEQQARRATGSLNFWVSRKAIDVDRRGNT